MDRDVFKRLGERFLSYADDPEAAYREGVDAEAIMESAGRALQAAVVAKEIVLDGIPLWFRNRPTMSCDSDDSVHVNDGTRTINYEMYWCYAVLWIEENIPGSGIVVPYVLKHPEKGNTMPGVTGDYPHSLAPSVIPTQSKDLWRGIAKASFEACRFLACRLQDGSQATDGGETAIAVTLSSPTRAVSLRCAAKEWFHTDPRTLKTQISGGKVKARQLSSRKWEFELDEVTEKNPNARDDADPYEYYAREAEKKH